jgi:hypothetical protein
MSTRTHSTSNRVPPSQEGQATRMTSAPTTRATLGRGDDAIDRATVHSQGAPQALKDLPGDRSAADARKQTERAHESPKSAQRPRRLPHRAMPAKSAAS